MVDAGNPVGWKGDARSWLMLAGRGAWLAGVSKRFGAVPWVNTEPVPTVWDVTPPPLPVELNGLAKGPEGGKTSFIIK